MNTAAKHLYSLFGSFKWWQKLGMDPVVQERMFCLLSAPAPRKNNSGGDVNSRSLSGGLPVFFMFFLLSWFSGKCFTQKWKETTLLGTNISYILFPAGWDMLSFVPWSLVNLHDCGAGTLKHRGEDVVQLSVVITPTTTAIVVWHHRF